MTSDCLLIYVFLFLPVFVWCDHKIVLFWSAEQFYDHIMQKLVKTGKNTEFNKQSDVKFWLNWRNYGSVSYSFSCTKINLIFLIRIGMCPKNSIWFIKIVNDVQHCTSMFVHCTYIGIYFHHNVVLYKKHCNQVSFFFFGRPEWPWRLRSPSGRFEASRRRLSILRWDISIKSDWLTDSWLLSQADTRLICTLIIDLKGTL